MSEYSLRQFPPVNVPNVSPVRELDASKLLWVWHTYEPPARQSPDSVGVGDLQATMSVAWGCGRWLPRKDARHATRLRAASRAHQFSQHYTPCFADLIKDYTETEILKIRSSFESRSVLDLRLWTVENFGNLEKTFGHSRKLENELIPRLQSLWLSPDGFQVANVEKLKSSIDV